MSTSDLTFDFDRQKRLGLPEAVLCAGKSVAQIDAAIAGAAARSLPLLLTRLGSALGTVSALRPCIAS